MRAFTTTSTRIGLALLSAAIVSACASGDSPTATVSEGVQPVTLTPAQTQAIEGGVKTMVERESGVTMKTVKATRQAGKPGLHVCGYVNAPVTGGQAAKDLPFYIELLEKDGKPVAERGQVGSDPARLSKVTFMCRHNQ